MQMQHVNNTCICHSWMQSKYTLIDTAKNSVRLYEFARLRCRSQATLYA